MLKSLTIIFIALVIWLSPIGGARTYIVDDDGFANYKTIGEAVVAASDGDTIYVKPGTYREEVTLNKTLSLMPLTGESGAIVLRGDGLETGIKITAYGCSLEGFNLANFTGPAIEVTSSGNIIKKSQFEKANPAILVRGSEENTIASNVMKDCQGGVVLWGKASDNIVTNNEIAGGIVSIILRDVGKNTISDNKASDASMACIWVMNSSNAEILGNTIQGGEYGIWTFNNTAGKLLDNDIAESLWGIYLMNSSGLEANNNSIRDGEFGVVLENSQRNILQKCSIANTNTALNLGGSSGNVIVENSILNSTDTALWLIYSDANNLAGNLISNADKGIIVADSRGNVLENNSLHEVKWALYVEGSSRDSFDNAISESNLVDGMPMAYYYGQSGKIIQGLELAHLTLAYCSGFTVQGNTITNDAIFLFNSQNNKILDNNVSKCYGMRLLASSANSISGNILSGNQFSGLFLVNSGQNEIRGNVATLNNQNGISLFNCNENMISENNAENNYETGIWFNLSNNNQVFGNNISGNPVGMLVLNSADNKIYHNNFLDNKVQAEDRNGNNIWDMGNVTGGNYWNDHTAKGNPSQGWAKIIRGGKTDNYPFQNLNGWLLAQERPVR